MIDAFEIGVSMTLADGMSGVLNTIMHGMQDLNREIDRGTGKFNAMKAAAIGLGAAFIGAGMLEGLRKITDEAGKLQNLQLNMKLAGAKPTEVRALTQQAWQLSLKNKDSSVVDVMRTASEVRNELTDTNKNTGIADVAAALPGLTDFITAARQANPNANIEGMAQNAIKAIDLRGKLWTTGADGKKHVDVPSLLSELDAMHKAQVYTNGQVGPADFRQAFALMGAAARNMSTDAAYAKTGEFANIVRAQKTGTMVSSLMQQFKGGQMTGAIAQNLIDSGVIDGKQVTWSKGHAYYQADKALPQYAMLQSDPFKFAQYVNEAVAKHFGITTDLADYKGFGRATTQRLGVDADYSMGQMDAAVLKQRGIAGNAGAAATIRAESLPDAYKQVSDQWENILTAFGKPGIPVLIGILHNVAGAFSGIADWASTHENAVNKIMKWTAIGGVTLIISGIITALIAGASLLAPVLLPLVGIGAALLVVKDAIGPAGTGAVVDWFKHLGTSLMDAWNNLQPTMKLIGDKIVEWRPMLIGAGKVILELISIVGQLVGFWAEIGVDIFVAGINSVIGAVKILQPALTMMGNGILNLWKQIGGVIDAVFGTNIMAAVVSAQNAMADERYKNGRKDGESAGDFSTRRARDHLDVNGDPMTSVAGGAVPRAGASGPVPGSSPQNPVYTVAEVSNGKTLVNGVTSAQASQAARMPVSTSGANGRALPWRPGLTAGFQN